MEVERDNHYLDESAEPSIVEVVLEGATNVIMADMFNVHRVQLTSELR